MIPQPAFAHGGFDHVLGTVVKVADNVLTIKTDKGNVDVKLDAQTELTRDGQKAQIADLKLRLNMRRGLPNKSGRREDCPPGSHTTGHAGPHQAVPVRLTDSGLNLSLTLP